MIRAFIICLHILVFLSCIMGKCTFEVISGDRSGFSVSISNVEIPDQLKSSVRQPEASGVIN